MKKFTLYTAILAVVGASLLFMPGASQGEAKIGAPAPELNATSLIQNLPQVTLDLLRDKVIYLDFWASWCAPCSVSIPWMNKMQLEYGNQGLAVVGVNEDSKSEMAVAFFKDKKPSFLALYDRGGEIAQRYVLPTMPTSFLIDRKGIVRLIHKGFKEEDIPYLTEEIKKLLNEK